MGFGANYRYIRHLVLSEGGLERRIEVVGNGCVGIGRVYPLECTLAETGAALGHLDWDLATDSRCQALASAVLATVRKYLATEITLNAATGRIEHPGKYAASGSFVNVVPDAKKKKKKKSKKKKSK